MRPGLNFTKFRYLNTIDVESGIISGIVIVTEGVTKNYTYHDKGFLAQLVALGNENELGIPSRLGHPSQVESKPTGFIGRYKNFRLQDGDPAKVLADLHLDPLTKDMDFSSKLSIWDYVIRLSQTASDSFGNSINFYYSSDAVTYVDENGVEVEDGTMGYEKVNDISSFDFSDLVDVPAGTTSLFENVNNSKNMFNKNKSEAKIKELEAQLALYRKALDLELTLADGTAITVVQDTPEPAPLSEGNQVQLSDGNPAPDGPHVLADGRIIETEGGEIINIELTSEDEPDAPSQESEGDFQSQIDEIREQLKGFQASLSKSVAGLAKRFNASQLSKQPGGAVNQPTGVNLDNEANFKASLRARIKEKRLNKNK